MAPYQDYKKYTSRFISEFGFESAPALRTLHRAIPAPQERHWQSLTFDAHDKGPGHQRRYGMYCGENIRFRFNPLRDFVYGTQCLQAEAMRCAYNHWRREFRGPGQEICSGILVWQLNDIWPGTSWALVDVDMNPKPAFYITKRALATVVVGMERLVTGSVPYIVTSYPAPKQKLQVWAINGHRTSLAAVLRLSAFDIESGEEIELPESEKSRSVQMQPNQTTEVTTLAIPRADTTVIAASLTDADTGEQLARWVDWPEPLKLVHFSKTPNVVAKITNSKSSSGDTDTITLTASTPIKGVVLSVPISEGGSDAVWSDNFIDLVPGEEIYVQATGLKGRKIEMRWLCDWENEEGFEL